MFDIWLNNKRYLDSRLWATLYDISEYESSDEILHRNIACKNHKKISPVDDTVYGKTSFSL